MRSVNYANGNYISASQNETLSAQSPSDGCRTPIAWHNRNRNLSKPLFAQNSSVNYSAKYLSRRSPAHRSSQRPSSPSATTTSSDDREEVPMVRHPPRRPNSRVTPYGSHTVDRRYIPVNRCQNYNHYSSEYGYRTCGAGTLRSTKSVPALAVSTVDGEPCPVHGSGQMSYNCHSFLPSMPQILNVRRFGSITDIRDCRLSNNQFAYLATIPENKRTDTLASYYYPSPKIQTLPPPASNMPLHVLSPKMQTRPVLFPALAEPGRMNGSYKISCNALPQHRIVKYGANCELTANDICCKGHLIVLWIILGVVTVGVIAGIILAVTMN